MITKVTLNSVASYKKPAVLETDMKVNLVYGLNGTGNPEWGAEPNKLYFVIMHGAILA